MENQPICFVITGFGVKMDYETGKSYNLDLSFKQLVKPAFEAMGFWCLRTIELNYTGSIEKKMYEFIQKADFVVADLSTLNPNALYELGVRHALKPYTTIMIAESSLFGDKSKNIPNRLPFDLNHYVVLPYEHLGDTISEETQTAFQEKLKTLIAALKEAKEQDSPVFNNIQIAPSFTSTEVKALKDEMGDGSNLQALLEEAEQLKDSRRIEEALVLFKKAKEMISHYQHTQDEFITQRLALCTYKSKADDLGVLNEALEILVPLHPDTSTNTETLGLAGAIYKRKHEITKDPKDAEQSAKMYNKGFYINDDYYTGINAAYMQNVLGKDSPEAAFYNELANHTRRKVLDITNSIIKSGSLYKRNDVQWILQSKAEAEFMLGKTADYQKTVIKLEDLTSKFSSSSFDEQMEKLKTNFKFEE